MAQERTTPTVSHARGPHPVSGAAVAPPSPTEVAVLDPRRLSPEGSASRLEALLRRAAVTLNVSGDIRVRIVDDSEMSAAHARHLGDPSTTDVLTFDLAEGAAASGAPLDVDVLVCIDEARRQAAARGHTPDRELLLYSVHAILHCLGHDDHDPAAAARMHAEEDRILEALGVGATYARPETAPDAPMTQTPRTDQDGGGS